MDIINLINDFSIDITQIIYLYYTTEDIKFWFLNRILEDVQYIYRIQNYFQVHNFNII